MNIDKKKTVLLNHLPILAGMVAFLVDGGLTPPVLFAAALTAAVYLAHFKLHKKNSNINPIPLLQPLASGLLCVPMKLFLYWDKPDFINRVHNLLAISLAAVLLLYIVKFKPIKKFLYAFHRLPMRKRLLLIFTVVEILFILSSYIITEKGVKMSGDEPHYLVISHSIARDFDLNVFNQYARDLYREFCDAHLGHHARVGKGFKVWYSYGHLPGISITLAPFFIFKIPNPLLYFLIRAFLGLFGALLAALIYLMALKLWKHQNLALFITTVFTLSTPIFFYSIHVFSELQACLLILASLYLLLMAQKQTNLTVLTAGFLLSITVFWGLKYSLFIYLFSAGFFLYYFFKKKDRKKAFLFVLFPLLFQLLFFYYLHSAYGNLNPMSIYNGVMTQAQQQEYYSSVQAIPIQKRVETLFGIFFDQKDGLLLYSPLYFFFFPGLLVAFRKFKTYWPHLLISSAGLGYMVFMGYSTVRAGYCPQARYLVPGAWVLMLFAVIYRNETVNRRLKKLFNYLPLYALAVVVYQLFNPFTLYQSATHINTSRPGLMFQQLSNLYVNLPNLLPSFAKVDGNFKHLPNIIFLALFVGFIFWAFKNIKKDIKKTSHTKATIPVTAKAQPTAKRQGLSLTAVVCFSLLVTMAALLPRIPTHNPVLLTKDGGIPCNIYAESRYKTSKTDWPVLLDGQKQHTFTISTLQPAPYFVFQFENNAPTPLKVDILNFDKKRQQVTVEAGKNKTITFKNPLFRKHKAQHFYRFHLDMGNSPLPDKNIYVRVFPAKRKP